MTYLVLTRRKDGFDPAHLPGHYAFLDRLRASGRLQAAGPFTDGSGGAYLLAAGSLAEAEAIVGEDPLLVHDCSEFDIREWNAK